MKLIGILALILGVCYVYGGRNAAFVGRRVDCKEYNREYFYNLSCSIKLINRNKQTYFVHASIKPVVIQNIRVRMKTYFKFRTQYHPHGVYVDEDVCAFWSFFNGTKILSINNFKNLPMQQISNVTCPLQGPRNFTFDNFELVPFRLPDFVNIGDWIFETYAYTNDNKEEVLLLNFKNYFGTEYVYSKS